jgi:hypothetical protein
MKQFFFNPLSSPRLNGAHCRSSKASSFACRFIFVGGDSGGQSQTAEVKPIEAAKQPATPEQLKMPEAQKGPDQKPVTEASLAEESKKMQETASKKVDATRAKVDILAAVKVDELKIPV